MVMAGGVKAESLLRCAGAVLAAATVLLLRLTTQTKMVLLIERKAVTKDVQALWVLTVTAGAAAGYQILQLFKSFYLSRFSENSGQSCRRVMAWACFLFDKGCTYLLFAATIAALQACLVALNGVHALQWSKLCNVYTRFCEQVAVALLCGLLASLAMAAVAALSARRLFRRSGGPGSKPRASPAPL